MDPALREGLGGDQNSTIEPHAYLTPSPTTKGAVIISKNRLCLKRMADQNKPEPSPESTVSENMNNTPLSRADSLPPFPASGPAPSQSVPDQPISKDGNQQPTVPPLSAEEGERGPSSLASTLPQQSPSSSLKIKPPNFGGGNSPLGKILAVLLILILLAIPAGSLILAYTNYKLITPPKIVQRAIDRFILITPLPKTTRLILRRTERKMANLKSATLETQVEFATESKNFPVSNAKITVKGPADFKTQNYSKTRLEISGEVAMEGLKISAAGEIRQIEDNLYFQLTEVPGGSFLPLDEVKNQWFILHVEELNKQKRTAEDEAQIQKIKEVFEAFVEKTYEWTKLEKGENKDVYTLKIKPPIAEINTLLFETIKNLEPKKQTNLEESIEKEEIERFTRNIKNIEIALEIDKKTSLISQVSLLFGMDLENPSNLYSRPRGVQLAPTSNIPITLKISTKLSDYDKPVIIEIPKDAKDLTKYQEKFRKELEKQNFNLPQEQDMPQKPEGNNSFRNLLDNQSPVLGEKSFWDLLLLDNFGEAL